MLLILLRGNIMIKKGIFGGTFDPIHLGHLYIAEQALNIFKLDEVVFIPTGNPPHKANKKVTKSKYRYDMVKLAIKNNNKFSISDYEVNSKDFNYTFKTLEYFNSKEKDTQWYFITGVDCLMDIYTWNNVSEIFKLCNLVVFRRDGYSLESIIQQKKKVEQDFKSNILFMDIPIKKISSTMIRNKILNHEDIKPLVPKEVYKYIIKNNIYS